MSDQSGLIDGVQFDKDDPQTRLFVAANYWRERAEHWRLVADDAHLSCIAAEEERELLRTRALAAESALARATDDKTRIDYMED